MNRFLAFDLETGGLDSKSHQITEIGAVLFADGEVVDSFGQVLTEHPKLDLTVKALRIQGRTMKDLAAGISEPEAYHAFADWIAKHGAQSVPVCSHNAIFDQGFWDALVFRQGTWQGKWPDKKFVSADPVLRGAWTCTRRLATSLDLPDFSLNTVAGHFGLARTTDFHGAVEDAELCGRVYHRLTTDAQVTA